jgi:hypothetical protein
MIDILILIVVALVVFWIARMIIGQLGLPPNITMIIYAVMALILLLVLLSMLGLLPAALR